MARDFRLQSYLFVCLFDFCLIPCESAVYLMMMMMMKVIYTILVSGLHGNAICNFTMVKSLGQCLCLKPCGSLSTYLSRVLSFCFNLISLQ